MKNKIPKLANTLADFCLLEDKHQNYSDKDLINVSLIFSHFITDVFYSVNKHHGVALCSVKAELIGTKIRELILYATGKDMHKLMSKL